jgi:hypothetical protein
MACLGAVQQQSSILGFSFQSVGGFNASSSTQTVEITVSVSNPVTTYLSSVNTPVTTEAKTTITFTLSPVSILDGTMTFIPFNSSLLSNVPSYVSNLTYNPAGLDSVISSTLGNLMPGCFVKVVLKITGGTGNIYLSANNVISSYSYGVMCIAGSLVVYKQRAGGAGELYSLNYTPSPNYLEYRTFLSIFNDTFTNMNTRLNSSYSSLMFNYIRINPIEFSNNPVYPINLKLELKVLSTVSSTPSYSFYTYYFVINIVVLTADIFNSPFTIPFNQPDPGLPGSYEMKDTYRYYIKDCCGLTFNPTRWGINGIGSGKDGLSSENCDYLERGQSYPIISNEVVSSLGLFNVTAVDIQLSAYGNPMRPKYSNWAYSAVSLNGWG